MGEYQSANTKAHELCETIAYAYLQRLLNQEHDSLDVQEESVDAQESKELGHPQQLQHFPALLRPSDRSVDGVHTGPFHQYGIEP